MLNIINKLKYFFEDCYRQISVREYSRLAKITPPTASKLLKEYRRENLLEKKQERGYLLFQAKRSPEFIDLSRIYWKEKLAKTTEYLDEEFLNPTVILFGSLAKAEAKAGSDIDLAVISPSGKIPQLKKFEKSLSRKFQIFSFASFGQIKNKELKNSILNGFVLRGRIKL